MYDLFPRMIWVALVLAVLFAGGCSDFDEMKSHKLYGQAESLLQEGDALTAETVLAELVAKYSRTQAAEKAQTLLQQLIERRELREFQQFVKILQSYQQVINGYYSMFAEYPPSIEALDQSGYFFDSEYLAEITPEGFQAYLWLAEDNSGYRVWCVNAEIERGYAIEGRNRKLNSFNGEEMRAQLEDQYQKVFQTGNLVVLALR